MQLIAFWGNLLGMERSTKWHKNSLGIVLLTKSISLSKIRMLAFFLRWSPCLNLKITFRGIFFEKLSKMNNVAMKSFCFFKHTESLNLEE